MSPARRLGRDAALALCFIDTRISQIHSLGGGSPMRWRHVGRCPPQSVVGQKPPPPPLPFVLPKTPLKSGHCTSVLLHLTSAAAADVPKGNAWGILIPFLRWPGVLWGTRHGGQFFCRSEGLGMRFGGSAVRRLGGLAVTHRQLAYWMFRTATSLLFE